MLSQRKRLLILAVPIAVSLALAGPAAAADSKSDKAILKAGVITKADVPAEWTSKRSNASSDALRGLKECKKINTAVAAAKKDEPRARSASSPIRCRSTRRRPRTRCTPSRTRRTPASSCPHTRDRPRRRASSGSEPRSSEIGPPPHHPPWRRSRISRASATKRLGYEIAATFTQNGGEATLYIDFIVVRVGRAVLGFVFTNVNARITQGPDIVGAVVQRVAAAEK